MVSVFRFFILGAIAISCGRSEKCPMEAPLPEEISNTEVTPEGKEAFVTYFECLQKECEDMDVAVMKALGKGIPGHATDCADAKEKFTCDMDVVPFWEAIGDRTEPLPVGGTCVATCDCGGKGGSAPKPTPSPSPKPAPKPSPKPSPKPAPTPAPREDSTADAAARSNAVLAPIVFSAFFVAIAYH